MHDGSSELIFFALGSRRSRFDFIEEIRSLYRCEILLFFTREHATIPQLNSCQPKVARTKCVCTRTVCGDLSQIKLRRVLDADRTHEAASKILEQRGRGALNIAGEARLGEVA